MTVTSISLPRLEVLGRPLDAARPDGVYLGPDGFEGWHDGPDMRREVVQRVAAAGDFDARGYPDARVLSLSGVIVSPSEKRTQYWRERLTGVLNDGGSDRVTVRENDTVRFADAGLVKTKVVTRPRARHVADWQMQLWCPDPQKYGELRTAKANGGDFCDVEHWGNAPATSVLRVDGSDANGYVLLGPTGRRIEVNTPLTAGIPHEVDLATGQLRVGGTVRYGALGQVDLWTTYPGKTVSVGLSNTDSSNRLTVTTLDTYL
jgi:hypothetical protein